MSAELHKVQVPGSMKHTSVPVYPMSGFEFAPCDGTSPALPCVLIRLWLFHTPHLAVTSYWCHLLSYFFQFVHLFWVLTLCLSFVSASRSSARTCLCSTMRRARWCVCVCSQRRKHSFSPWVLLLCDYAPLLIVAMNKLEPRKGL